MTGCATCCATDIGMRNGVACGRTIRLGSVSSGCAPYGKALFVTPQYLRLMLP